MTDSQSIPTEVSPQELPNLTVMRSRRRPKAETAKTPKRSRRIVAAVDPGEPASSLDLDSFEYVSSPLDVEKAVLCVAYLLEFATGGGNVEISGPAAQGLAYMLRDSISPEIDRQRRHAEKIEKTERGRGERASAP